MSQLLQICAASRIPAWCSCSSYMLQDCVAGCVGSGMEPVPGSYLWLLLQGLNGAIKTPKGYNESANGMADYPSTARLANQARPFSSMLWVGCKSGMITTGGWEECSRVKWNRQH